MSLIRQIWLLLVTALLLALTVPLFFRRRWPLGVPLVVWSAAVGLSYVIPRDTNNSVPFLVALWFAIWVAR